jgi:hypothetical protein
MRNLTGEWDRDWAIGMAVIVGVVVAVVAFVIGWILINRRRARLRELAAQAGEWKDQPTPQDSFRYGLGMARRKTVRLSGNEVPILVTFDGNTDSPWDGWVIDRSHGGLRLKVPQPIQVGAILRVRALRAANAIPWVEVQVKNARDKSEFWEIGCQFLSDPPEEILRSFGSK